MAPFLPQRQAVLPNANIDFSPIAQVGEDVAKAITTGREKNALAQLAQAAKDGASADQLTDIAIASKSPTLVGLGLQQKFAAQKAASSRATFSTQTLPDGTRIQVNNLTGEQKAAPLSLTERKDVKRAGATNVTVATGDQTSIEQLGNKKFAERAATNQANRFDALIQAGNTARTFQSNLNLMDAALVDAKTGGLAPLRTAFQSVAENAGIDTSQFGSLGDAELIESVAQRLAPQLREKGSGQQSDTELKGFLASLPGLSKSLQGNKMIVSQLRLFSAHTEKVAEIAGLAEDGTITRSEARKRINKLPPAISPRMAKAIRMLGKGNLAIRPNGGPKGGPDVIVNPTTGEIRRWKGGKWQAIN